MSANLTAIPEYLTTQPRWVTWRTIKRKDGKPTKAPKTARDTSASSTDPDTWAPFEPIADAIKRRPKLFDGCGIVLGDTGSGEHLCGVDLDSCLDDQGTLAAWAQPFIACLPTYTEISPSGSGLKAFFRAAAADAGTARGAFALADGAWGCKRSIGANGANHGPAVEVYIGPGRFFTVTGNQWPTAPYNVALLDLDALLRLAKLLPKPAAGGNTSTRGTGSDNSRSAVAFRKGAALVRDGSTFEEMCAGLHADPETAEWVREKGEANNRRELRRIWDRCQADEAVDVPVEFSESALAYLFTAEHADDLLFVHEWGKWLRWDAGRWREDFTVTVFDAARKITARAGDKAIATMPRGGKKIAAMINKAATIAAIERLCRHHHRHVRSDDVFDADRRLLNTPDGEINMHDVATRRQHRRDDYMTRMTNVSAAPKGTDCPIWRAFLARIMGEDGDNFLGQDRVMVPYLQRVCGYMLTGSVQEHVLFFGYGTGANGKSTFASVLLGILGSGPTGYAAVAPISTFTASRTDQHPTDLAMLRGVRCVIAQETEEGRAWAVSKLKMMTGGDPISARFMRQDFFTYEPQFKLLILGNHKPALHGIDEALRRRIHLIPFTVTIPAPERDPKLGEKLKAEYPAILAWMIEGCGAWQNEGLKPPAKVVEATRKYLVDEDALAAWMGEACLVHRKYSSTPLIELFASWKAWAEANGERVGQRKELAKALDTRPELTRHDQPGTGRAAWDGIIVKSPSVIGGAPS